MKQHSEPNCAPVLRLRSVLRLLSSCWPTWERDPCLACWQPWCVGRSLPPRTPACTSGSPWRSIQTNLLERSSFQCKSLAEIILTLPDLPDLPDRKYLYQSISKKGKVNFNGFPIFPINWVHIYQSISNTEYKYLNGFIYFSLLWILLFSCE